MHRFIWFAALCLGWLTACNPPVRTIPSRVKSGLDSVSYTGIVEQGASVDLSQARFLAKVKVGDLGVTLDCTYPDALANAMREARAIGGNLLVITWHTRNQSKSLCHRVRGDIYRVESLEGREAQIRWHADRPLLPGDLRGKPVAMPGFSFPPLQVSISCRVGGDFYQEALVRTETVFQADSTFLPVNAQQRNFALRRAQLHFDLAELHARRLKARIDSLGADLPAITGQYRQMTAEQQERLSEQRRQLDTALAGGDTALEQWEREVRAELDRLAPYFGEWRIELRKKKRKG